MNLAPEKVLFSGARPRVPYKCNPTGRRFRDFRLVRTCRSERVALAPATAAAAEATPSPLASTHSSHREQVSRPHRRAAGGGGGKAGRQRSPSRAATDRSSPPTSRRKPAALPLQGRDGPIIAADVETESAGSEAGRRRRPSPSRTRRRTPPLTRNPGFSALVVPAGGPSPPGMRRRRPPSPTQPSPTPPPPTPPPPTTTRRSMPRLPPPWTWSRRPSTGCRLSARCWPRALRSRMPAAPRSLVLAGDGWHAGGG